MTTDTDRHYAMGILAAKRAMSDGSQFSAMVNQAEDVLAKPSLEEKVIHLRRALSDLVEALAANDEDGLTEFAEPMAAARAALRLK